MGYKIKRILVGTQKIRPNYTLEYDFTTSDGGWTIPSGVTRDSNGIYISGTSVEKHISAPSSLYTYGNPKKIIITYNKTGTDCSIGLSTSNNNNGAFISPRSNELNNFAITLNSSNALTQSMGLNPTGVITWEMDIDNTTTNRNITHKITGVSDIADTTGAIKNLFINSNVTFRIINRSSNAGMKIRKAVFYF